MRTPSLTRAIFTSNRCLTGLSRTQLVHLVQELGHPWELATEAGRERRRGHAGSRGGGRRHELVFYDRLLVTTVHLRHGLTHAALAAIFGVDRSTVSRAITEIRPLLVARGFQVEEGARLHTLADVVAYLHLREVKGRLDATEVQVRRPRAHVPGRGRFVSGKARKHTVKVTHVSCGNGKLLWAGAGRPGRMHDQTAVKTEGLDDLLDQFPTAHLDVDAGYRGLVRDHPDRVHGPPKKPPKHAVEDELLSYELARHAQSSSRIPVEHSIAAVKINRAANRHYGIRDQAVETYLAAAVLTNVRQMVA